MSIEELDPIYFHKSTWSQRLNKWLKERAPEFGDFYRANESNIASSILEGETALKMVVNISPEALLGFLSKNRYENTYERKAAIGEHQKVNRIRDSVDRALFGNHAPKYYFGAVALGGCGVRFYGEYCLVIRDDVVEPSTQIIDRNSWDMEFEPLKKFKKKEVVKRLRGKWRADATHIAKLKVLPQLSDALRLTTTGTVSDAILHDESFIEIHKQGSFFCQRSL